MVKPHTAVSNLQEETQTVNQNGIEIERKFLIIAPGEQWLNKQPGSRRAEILQTYLVSKPGETRRIREWRENNEIQYIQTIKKPLNGIAREELETEISQEEYKSLLKEKDPQRRQIAKIRWSIPFEGHLMEIDHYANWYDDRSTLEVELGSEEEEFRIPPEIIIIREVTGDPRYLNSSMAREFPPRD